MARELRRLLISPERLASAESELPLNSAESRYLTRVLRLGDGDRFSVIDGQGCLWEAHLQGRDQARLLQSLAAPLQRQPPPQPRLLLAAAVVKRDFEVVVRMAVELGVDRLIPLLCERTAVQGQLRPERWRTIAAEAAEQCERLWMPQIDQPTPLAALLAEASAPGAAACLRCWATTRRDGLMPLDQLLQLEAWASTPDAAAPLPTGIWLACGPEGGWSEAEEQQVLGLDWQPVGLGQEREVGQLVVQQEAPHHHA